MEGNLQPHLVWPGPSSEYLLNRLTLFMQRQYPESRGEHFQLARNLEEQIRMVIRANNRMTAIDNEVYFLGNVKELSVVFMIRNKNEEVFPNIILELYELRRLEEDGVNELFGIIVDTMEYFLKKKLDLEVTEDWTI